MQRTNFLKWYFLLCFIAAILIILFLLTIFVFQIVYFHYPFSRIWKILVMTVPFLWAAKEMWDGVRGKKDVPADPKPTDASGPNIPPYGVS